MSVTPQLNKKKKGRSWAAKVALRTLPKTLTNLTALCEARATLHNCSEFG